MDLNALSKHLSDRQRIGLTDVIADKLGVASEDVTRGRLLSQLEGEAGHLVVQFLGCFVIDDTDFFGDGEIYWWAIPAIVNAAGQVQKSALHGLPTGMPPHKCGDQEWMTNLSLDHPPVWAVIPPGDDVSACVIRVGIYDDDRAPADVPAAVSEGLEAYINISSQALPGPDHIINPVRDAIFAHLKGADDDILIDQDLALRRGEQTRFGVGMIGSVINSMARAYYFVRDTKRTQQFGPITLHRGQKELVRFAEPVRQGGRIALFARGIGTVTCSAFGELTLDTPFINRVVELRQAPALAPGFDVVCGDGPAKFVAYYTPPYS